MCPSSISPLELPPETSFSPPLSVVGGGASFKKLSDGLPAWPASDEEQEDDLEDGSFSDDEL